MASLAAEGADVEAVIVNRVEPSAVAALGARVGDHEPTVYAVPEAPLLAAPTLVDALDATVIGGAYYAALGRVDAIAITAGVGENSVVVRGLALEGLQRLGIEIDPARNCAKSREAREISTDDSEVKVLVIPTDEELEMATQALALVDADRARAATT